MLIINYIHKHSYYFDHASFVCPKLFSVFQYTLIKRWIYIPIALEELHYKYTITFIQIIIKEILDTQKNICLPNYFSITNNYFCIDK